MDASVKLVEVDDPCWIGLDDCYLEDGGQGTSVNAVMESAGRILDAHNSMVENFQKEHIGKGPVMDCFIHLRGGRQRTIKNVDGADSAQYTTIRRGSGDSLPIKPVEEEFIGKARDCATSITTKDASFEDLGTPSDVEHLDSLASSGKLPSSDTKPAYNFTINTQPQPNGTFHTMDGDMEVTTQPQPNRAFCTMEGNMEVLAGANNSTIQLLLDSQVESLSSSWKGAIPFNIYPTANKNNVTPEIFDSSTQPVDIYDYLNGQKLSLQRLYIFAKEISATNLSRQYEGP